ncbi:amidohydrolase family protein [Pseudonocardia sp. KRD-184]|uniref:Amidohydrolase family protein n=1 Tax=Pseudonocardia oceani TaxID=2792013 RepID=A0ABS6U1W1_9PSEU|nr:amidohydrolase family protein [Pseudonocardia oceani]MBW0089406.1 amidohydrolase family protein [Pseudonocardia oceani]MBW0096412.1 amidohydrolase family protein [Pseudonocardia oceani]MBW0109138.1 amidohydrolase family protein [Pseudonocardia oceani]MBW0122413.1 amidohydrolase family protein [Pseudonocardia oceani]MBW0126212.1 amidohydrolase family protein [Pseudonocardia oceani]
MADGILISGGTVVDGTGAAARPGEAVLLRGGRIVALGAAALAQAAPDETRIDATGKTVMPGLIDAHTHLTFGEPTGNDELFHHRTEAYSSMLSAYNARKVLRAGVTSVLDADCLWNIGCELRDAIESGIVEGPRMRAGGQALMTMLGGTAGRMIADEGTTAYATVVRGRDMMVNEIRRQIKYGVDWIKIMVTGLIPSMKGPEVKVWNFDELRTVCDTAHELNTKVVAHCRNSESTRDAARAGVDLIYHASYMDDEALEAVLEAGSALCPTFTLLGNLADYGAKVGSAPELLEVFRAEIAVTAKQMAKAHAAGVPFLTGSETGFAVTPVGEWHARELEMFVEYMDFSPMDAIVAATRNGAFAMRMEGELGTLEEGRIADVLVVDGDPLADVKILQDKAAIAEVIKGGKRIDITTPIPEQKLRSSDQVRFLASCPLTRSLAFTEEQLEKLSHV